MKSTAETPLIERSSDKPKSSASFLNFCVLTGASMLGVCLLALGSYGEYAPINCDDDGAFRLRRLSNDQVRIVL
jgi:hypothetical protein